MDKHERPMPPQAARQRVSDTRHGITRHDDYAWLRADNWQAVMQDPALLPSGIRDYLEAENAYTEAAMRGSEALQEQLFREMKGRIKEDDSSVPAPDGPYAYYSSHVMDGQQPLYCRKPRDLAGAEQILIDGNKEGEGKPFFRFGGLSVSPDHTRLAWSFDDKGSEFYRIHVRELLTGTDLADEVANTAGGAVWTADGKSILYTHQDENHRPLKIYRHMLGTDATADTLIYEETDTGFFTGVGKTQSERFIVIDAHDHETSESWLIDATSPGAEPRLVAPRRKGIEYDIDDNGDELFIHTNADDAEDYKIVRAPLSDPSPAYWTDLVPHRPGCLILGMVVRKNWLVRLEREDGLPRIVIRDLKDGAEHAIAFDEDAYALGFGEMLEYETDMLRFTYSSMTTPSEVFDYNMSTRERSLRKRQEVPSGHDASQYVTRRLQAPAPDGETVPVTLLYRKDTPLTDRRRCGSMATAPTASPFRRRSTPIYFRWWTAVLSMPSPIPAAARIRATAGTSTASATRR
ncbi:hypothetical protein BH10PSE7_BH10PSE7_23390 [soil metagenome]